VSVPASGSDRGWPRGQTETVENLASDGRILNSGQNTYPAAAAWTFQHIHGENSRHQLGPAVIARMRLFFFGAVSMSAGFRVRRSSRLKPIVWGKSTFSRRIQVPVLSSEWPQDAIQTCPYQVASSYRTATPARKSCFRRYINNDSAGTFTLLPLVRIWTPARASFTSVAASISKRQKCRIPKKRGSPQRPPVYVNCKEGHSFRRTPSQLPAMAPCLLHVVTWTRSLFAG